MIGKQTRLQVILGQLATLGAVLAPLAWIAMVGAPDLRFDGWPPATLPTNGGAVFVPDVSAPPGVSGASSRARTGPGGPSAPKGSEQRGPRQDRDSVTHGDVAVAAPVAGTTNPAGDPQGATDGTDDAGSKGEAKATKQQAKADAKAAKQEARAEAKAAKQDAKAEAKAARQEAKAAKKAAKAEGKKSG